MNKLFALFAGLIMAASLMGLIIIGGRNLPTAVKAAVTGEDPDPPVRTIEDLDPEDRICFYNWLNEEARKYNFGPSGYGDFSKYDKVYGELLDRLTDDGDQDEKLPDPALMAAVAYAIDRTHDTDILAKEYKETNVPGEQVNLAAKNLMDSTEYRKEVLGKIKKELEAADIEVKEIGAYTSMMWMVPNGYPDRPAITIADSNHEGGHCLVIKWKNGDVLRLRIECGYQPMDVNWPDNPPDNPPDDDNPPPTTTPVTTSPPETTKPTETTTVTTTLAPKNTQEAVPVETDPNNGHGTGTAPADTGLRPEPTWQTTQAPTTQPTTQAPKQTTTQTVTHDGKDYVVDEYPEATEWKPQSDAAGDTPSDAAASGIVANEPPPSSGGGGGFADRY
jgi:hypothetical protein